MTLTVTVKDDETGDTQTVTVMDNDYFILCTGTCYVADTQAYLTKGTHVLTIKGQRAVRIPPMAAGQ